MGKFVMNEAQTTGEKIKSRLQDLTSVSRLKTVILTILFGGVIGNQIVNPNKRVIEAIVGLAMIFLLWRYSTLVAVWLIMVMYPLPFAISIGTSNTVFMPLIFAIHLIRLNITKAKFITDRRYNRALLILSAAYILSFINLDQSPQGTKFAYLQTLTYFSTLIFFYLLINVVTDEQKLRRTIKVVFVSTFVIFAFTILEMLFPARIIIPGWFGTIHSLTLKYKDLRVGGPWHSYELMSEFCAMTFPLILFMIIRAKRLLTKTLYGTLLLVDLLLLFATITRGGLVSLTVGLVYMAYLCRKDLDIVKLAGIAGALIMLALGLEAFVAKYTVSGSLFQRMVSTTFERGVVPDSRVGIYEASIRRAMQHPFLGHSPGWDFSNPLSETQFWPHNAYLHYWNIVGLLGLGGLMWFLYNLFKASAVGFKYSIVRGPFPYAISKIFNVMLVILLVDMLKIDFVRNSTYVYSVWLLFGLIAATRRIIYEREKKGKRPAPS